MKKQLVFLLPLVALEFGCSPSPQKKVEVLQQEVLDLHDSAMAKMGALYAGRKELTYLKDSVMAQDSAARQKLGRQVESLVQADEHMMQWMRAYRNPDGQPPQQALEYLQQEKAKIEQVRREIDQTLRAADSLAAPFRTQKP